MAEVSDIIAQAQAYASNLEGQARAFIDTVKDLSSQEFKVEAPEPIDLPFAAKTEDALSEILSGRPSKPATTALSANIPDAPDVSVKGIDLPPIPQFTKNAPGVSFGTAPSPSIPAIPAVPSFKSPDIPAAPNLTVPSVPAITGISFPQAPNIVLPQYTATAPIDNLLEPTNNFSFYEQAYASAILDKLKAKLLADMTNGGYGIEPADEEALWFRLREREDLATQSQVDEITRQYAATGFPLPPGAMQAAFARAGQDRQNKLSSASREIALKRGDLYVQNRQFAMQQSAGLEQILLGYHGSVQERALNVARITAEVAISFFDLKVRIFNTRMQAYQIEAQVFESKIRAALSQVEIYRAQISAKGLELEAQKIAMEAYRTQIAGIQATVDVYKTRMEAAKVYADIERTRMEAFRSQIDAHVATIQGKKLEVDIYEAKIRGEVAKVQGFEAEVRAFAERVRAAESEANIRINNLRGQVDTERLRMDGYNAKLSGYRIQGEVLGTNVRAEADMYRADIALMEGVARATGEAFRVQLEESRMMIAQLIETFRASIQNAQLKLSGEQSQANLRLNAAGVGVNYFSAAVAGSLSAMNGLAAQVETTEK